MKIPIAICDRYVIVVARDFFSNNVDDAGG